MSLSAGTKLGPYEVIGPLGSGGMGEVYRARDTRLGRDVAVKVLPAERLSDPHRRARFVQEARAASALNHPNIVTIHQIESAEGIDFIVMELVPGETLAQRLRRGALLADEAVRLAIPVADALAAAHAAGVVHRDLKPGNVMVRPDGVVKVLDFGLAKLVRGDTADSDEATATAPPDAAPLSRPGAVTGTAGYMSPEQASGGTVDARSDVFAFGLLLYEMITGQRAFAGTSGAEAMAAVLKDQPKPPGELAPGLPKELERIVLRCLRKDPGRRFQSMADAKIELLEVKEESDSQASAPAGTAAATRLSRRRWMAWSATGFLIVASGTTLTWWRLSHGERPAPVLVPLAWTGHDGAGTFSPDGNQIAFSSLGEKGDNEDIWLKIVGEAEARRLTTDPARERWPAWSPDGKQIAFVRVAFEGNDSISLVSPLGGSERRLLDFPTSGPPSWSPDGRWLAAARARARGESTPDSGGIHLIPTGGGGPQAVTFPRPPLQDAFPAFSPDGRRLAYVSCGGQEQVPACDVYVLALDSEFRPQGEPRRVTERPFWAAGLAWTRDGRSILYGSGSNPENGLMRVRADGSSPPVRIDLAGGGAGFPTVACTQERLAFHRLRWNPDVYHLPLEGSPRPLIASTFPDAYPQYSPDGRRIAFESGRAGEGENIWLANADGSDPTRLTRGPDRGQGSPRWSPDGRSVAFDVLGQDGRWDVWTIGIDGSRLRQVNTFVLLASLALTAHWCARDAALRGDALARHGWAFGAGAIALLGVGKSGAIAALGDTLYPAASLLGGLAQDLSPTAHFLVRLRVAHPILALAASLVLALVAARVLASTDDPGVRRLAWAVPALALLQIALGLLNVALLAPVWLQLVHLLLADVLWIVFVLLAARALALPTPSAAVAQARPAAA